MNLKGFFAVLVARIRQKRKEADERLRLEAGQRYAEEEYKLGLSMRSYVDAAGCFRRAAKAGHAGAQFNLGLCYEAGKGVPQDFPEAVKWYRLAAEQGDAGAQCNLGAAYNNGTGVQRDLTEAVKWCRLAANKGISVAQSNLGRWHFCGRGVPQDYTEAVKWLRLAAEQGDADGQTFLGLCYRCRCQSCYFVISSFLKRLRHERVLAGWRALRQAFAFVHFGATSRIETGRPAFTEVSADKSARQAGKDVPNIGKTP